VNVNLGTSIHSFTMIIDSDSNLGFVSLPSLCNVSQSDFIWHLVTRSNLRLYKSETSFQMIRAPYHRESFFHRDAVQLIYLSQLSEVQKH